MQNIAATFTGALGIVIGLHAAVTMPSVWAYVAWISGMALFAIGVVRSYE